MNKVVMKRYVQKLYSRGRSMLKNTGDIEAKTEESIEKIYFPNLAQRVEGPNGTTVKPIRILYAALVYDYGKRSQGLSIEECFFFNTLMNMGMQIVKFDYDTILRRHGKKVMNKMLREAVYRYEPDLLFTVLFKDELDRNVISEISNDTRTISLNWFCDDYWRFDTFSSKWAGAFNWIVTTHKKVLPKYAEIGYDHVILSQWACNPNLYKRLDIPKEYDVAFVGQPFGNRRHIIAKLRSAGLQVHTWGFGWPNGRVTLQQMVRIFNQSKINLDLSEFSRGGKGIKARPFEIAGTGGFVMTEHLAELSDYFEIGKEIECYRNIDDLIDKIRWYLVHDSERQEIALNGYSRVLSKHTYQQRFREIFKKIGLS